MKTDGAGINSASPGVGGQNEALLQINIRGKMVMKLKKQEDGKDEVDQTTVNFLLKILRSKTPE